MVGEFVGGAFCGDAAALVEGFVEDADSVEGAAVLAGRGPGALKREGLLALFHCIYGGTKESFKQGLEIGNYTPSAWTSCTQDTQ